MKTLATKQDDYVRTAIRLPPDLHAEVRSAASAAGRTMNAELIARVAGPGRLEGSMKLLLKQNEELRAMMREMLAQIDLLK